MVMRMMYRRRRRDSKYVLAMNHVLVICKNDGSV
jgi:ribosomal protein L32